MVQPLWEAVWCFLTKVDILLPYSLAFSLLGIYPNELKTYVNTKTFIQMFITVLFITEKTQQCLRYSSVGECVNMPFSGPDDGILLITKRK